MKVGMLSNKDVKHVGVLDNSSGSGVPANALLDEDGAPLLDEDGGYLLDE